MALGCHASSIMSAEVAIQKFSFPFSCAAQLSQQHDLTQSTRIQVKTLEHHSLQGVNNTALTEQSPVTIIGALVQSGPQAKDNNAKALPEGATAGPAVQAKLVESTQNAVLLCGQSVPEKATTEGEDQRPAAKRQLSSESAARSVAVVKKSAVRKEPEEEVAAVQRSNKGQPGQRPAVPGAAGKRRRRKDLFTNSEVFHRVDSHVIRAGAEVTTRIQHILL